jgi:hypothetical protein
MRKLIALFVAGAVCAMAVAALAGAANKSTVWTAPLTSRQEVPKQVVKTPLAHGLFKATLNGSKLSWKLTYSKLSGPATAAHIHMGAKGTAGNVVVALCGGTPACKSGLSGTTTLTSAMTSAFKKHLLYVNVHTAKNPNGEIRGQILGM